MKTLAFTVDGAFVAEAELPALDGLVKHASAGHIALRTSALCYDASHQSAGLCDVNEYLNQMDHLRPPGYDLSENERIASIHGTCHDATVYTAQFCRKTFDEFTKLCVQIYGRGPFRLRPYEEYRALTLYEHSLSDGDWFVTCDEKRILGQHGRRVLPMWSIRACSPTSAFEMIENG